MLLQSHLRFNIFQLGRGLEQGVVVIKVLTANSSRGVPVFSSHSISYTSVTRFTSYWKEVRMPRKNRRTLTWREVSRLCIEAKEETYRSDAM